LRFYGIYLDRRRHNGIASKAETNAITAPGSGTSKGTASSVISVNTKFPFDENNPGPAYGRLSFSNASRRIPVIPTIDVTAWIV